MQIKIVTCKRSKEYWMSFVEEQEDGQLLMIQFKV